MLQTYDNRKLVDLAMRHTMNPQRIRFTYSREFVIGSILWFLFLALGSTNATAQVLWQQANGPERGVIRALAISASGDIFAGTEGGGVFRTTNNGDNWTAVNTGLPTFVRALAINTSGHIFAGTDRNGVYRSTANGASWMATDLKDTNVRALAINTSGHIFAGTAVGVYVSMGCLARATNL
ncbi:MAG: WD40/YVTN/BNR-like repeat-containing protein [bacterium]